jgi:ATP-dependent Clp protease ATP-binding subunit ClpA
MTSIPVLSDLVREVLLRSVAEGRDPVRQIGEAERLSGELARAEGLSWADIGAPRGLSRQGAQQRYGPFLTHLTLHDLVEAGALQQFGETALAALRQAESHAIRLGRDTIDSGDLLWGLLEDHKGSVVAAVREMEVDPSVLRSELERSGQPASTDTDSHAPAVGAGHSQAPVAGVGHSQAPVAGVGHSQAPVAGVGHSQAPVAGVGHSQAPAGVGRPSHRDAAVVAASAPLSNEARRALDGAISEARGHLVAPGHLLLGLLRNPAGRAAQVLGAHGVTKSAAMAAILAVGSRQTASRS